MTPALLLPPGPAAPVGPPGAHGPGPPIPAPGPGPHAQGRDRYPNRGQTRARAGLLAPRAPRRHDVRAASPPVEADPLDQARLSSRAGGVREQRGAGCGGGAATSPGSGPVDVSPVRLLRSATGAPVTITAEASPSGPARTPRESRAHPSSAPPPECSPPPRARAAPGTRAREERDDAGSFRSVPTGGSGRGGGAGRVGGRAARPRPGGRGRHQGALGQGGAGLLSVRLEKRVPCHSPHPVTPAIRAGNFPQSPAHPAPMEP